MDLYTFTVENFFITDTRALHNDTLKLSYSAYVNGDAAVPPRLISLGDFDNGEYSTVDYVPSDQSPGLANVVINDPTAKVAFIFQLVNAGNVPDGALSGRSRCDSGPTCRHRGGHERRRLPSRGPYT